MKIAIIGQKGIPSRAGGVEIHVEEIGKRLANKGNDITAYCRLAYCDEIKEEHEKIKIQHIKSINTKHLDAITYTFKATMHAIRQDYDIIHYHALGPSLLSFIPRIFSKKKVVCTVHGLDWQREKWGKFAKKILQVGEIATVVFPNKTISVSESLTRYYNEKYNNDTVFIPNGIDKKEYNKPDIIKKKYSLDKDEYILFLARLVPEKGVHYLIEAYNKLNTNKKLVIAGDASHSNDYVKKVKDIAKNNKNIIFTGFVKGQELEELFSNAYTYVLPSEIEGLPISLLEAMSYGQCCLVSDIEQNIEVVQNYGYTFESKNINSLYEKIDYILKNPDEVENMKKQAKPYITAKYNWDLIAKQTEEVYKSLLNGRK